MYNWLYDHTHFLPPKMNKQWKQYWLISDEGHEIGVDFTNGQFFVKKPNQEIQAIHPQNEDGLLINRTEPQNFPVTEPWQINNGLFYFPVAGRRYVKGDWGEYMTFYCGWKIHIKDKNRTIQVTYHMTEKGDIFPEVS